MKHQDFLICKFSKCQSKLALSFQFNILVILKTHIIPSLQIFDPKDYLILVNDKCSKTITHIDWSHDSKYVATALLNHKLYIWDLDKQSIVKELSHDEIITAISFFGDKNIVVSALKNGALRFWEIQSGKTIFWSYLEPNITTIKFSENGDYLVIGYMDGNFEIHQYREKFNNIYSGNIKKLSKTETMLKNRKNSRNKNRGLFKVFKKKKLKNNKIYEILFKNDHEFFILSECCKIRLFNLKTKILE